MGYAGSAKYYDRIYAFKDYRRETDELLRLVAPLVPEAGGRALDVACGTGQHLRHLKRRFRAEGLDRSPELLAIARVRNPTLTFHRADMRDFELGGRFDLVTCLFSSIGYMTSTDELHAAVARMARHLLPGGVLAVEPWFTPSQWTSKTVHALYVDDPDLKIARINVNRREGRVSVLDFQYLVGTPEETIHFTETHRLGLFEVEEMIAAFRAAGLEATHDPQGITGRGLYIGRRAVAGG